jgi:hypothetical protein
VSQPVLGTPRVASRAAQPPGAYAYRDHALAEPAYYNVMLARPVPEFAPSAEDVKHGRTALQLLLDAVTAAADAGRISGADPQHIGEVVWAAAHGAVSLELAGHLDDDAAKRVFSDLNRAALAAYLTG